jgi:hypothetical protein
VQAASVSLHGPHGQHIENVHLEPYSSEDQFWNKLYCGPYSRLLNKAKEFVENTGGAGDDLMVFIRSVDVFGPLTSLALDSSLDVYLVVALMLANMNMLRCHDTIVRSLRPFIIALPKTPVPSRINLHMDGL